jgi:hypothetical protein
MKKRIKNNIIDKSFLVFIFFYDFWFEIDIVGFLSKVDLFIYFCVSHCARRSKMFENRRLTVTLTATRSPFFLLHTQVYVTTYTHYNCATC